MTSAIAVLWIALAAPFNPEDESVTCADCHPAIVESYAKHGMASTLGPASFEALAPMAGTRLKDQASGYEYSIDLDAGGFALFERKDGPEGFGHFERRRKIAMWIGAGKQDRSLVLEHENRWYFAPVEWSTKNGLVLAPHQEISPHSRLEFPVTSECLSCHMDTPPDSPYPLNLSAETVPTGIGCAGCHGDTRRHLESLGEPGTIIRLANLPPERQLDVCARCHLQGDARIEMAPEGQINFSPGDDLFAERAAFVSRNPTDDFGFVSQSDRLALSACMTGSDEALTCTTCHDPHAPASQTTRLQYDRACASCHQAEDCGRPEPQPISDDPATSCTSCHMRKSSPFDLRHVTVTDHWIRKTPPPARELNQIRVHASPGADLVRFRWPGERSKAKKDPELQLEDAGALAMALTHLRHPERALPLFSQARQGGLPPSLSGLPAFHFMTGRANEAVQRNAEAEKAYRAVLTIEPGHAEARVNLGLLLANRGSSEALKLLSTTATQFPQAEAPWRNLAVLHFKQRDAAKFEGAMRNAIQRNPEIASVRFQFGMFFLQMTRFAEARDEFLATTRIDPDVPMVWSRLGIALFELGEQDLAKAAFQEALRRDPNDENAATGLRRFR